MGRFEKQPDNPRARGDLSRAAENALWAVVEDLENLQQHVLRSLQEEVKRLQAEKNRLGDDIQRLLEEKEQLQQVRQITEQQVLIRQLAEALAKHISSQLQSSLTTLANEAIESNSSQRERAALGPGQTQNNEKVEQMLGSLDDTITITFNSLQQELKNYQSNISQQLSRMQNQQQQGEYIIAELINRLQGLEKTIAQTPLTTVQVSPPTVLQPAEEPAATVSLPTILQPNEEPVAKLSPPTVLQPAEEQQKSSWAISPQSAAINSQAVEPLNAIPVEFSQNTTKSQPEFEAPEEATFLPESESSTEPMSFRSSYFSESETTAEPTVPSPEATPPPTTSSADEEEISVFFNSLSESETKPEPTLPSLEETPAPLTSNSDEPISVLSNNLSSSENQPAPGLRSRKQGIKPPSLNLPNSSKLSTIQIGFLLIVLSAVVSSLYNVAIKVIFQDAAILGVVQVERLMLPTLGNTLLILMLRLLVVVPLMLLLAPIMHPPVWQDLQNLFTSVKGNANPDNLKTRKVLQLSIASGCFLFLSQVLIYVAIGQVTTGMAIALFFIYPLISGLLSWLLFRDRPSVFRYGAMGALFCGELLVLGGATSPSLGNVPLGSTTAIMSGVAFAFYVVLTRICANKVHPVSFTLINFATMLLLSFIGFMVPLPEDLSSAFNPAKLLEIILSAFILGVLTLFGYVVNNVGIRQLGAIRSAIIGASVPFLTVIFAGLLIQENLEVVQILGVLLVTFGAAAFSIEKMRNQPKSSNSAN
ncbi:EamA family transporter [Tolypothrix sp. PCC 7910]|uniref:EamA family transporter n=1 Tax=Tolypothrix sp. PCC 7910 TaxID=2099387 RepID=UPI0014278FE7|nr:EamA family transporter [Tolypothrix sp. PCC 7910]QIR37600.1 EamA family transporter [Tolypothrix sp. PCC 7910]